MSIAKKTVLIVEDNEKNMKLVRDILRHNGHATIEAQTGGDGVRLASEKKPDLILMDIQLPDLSLIHISEQDQDLIFEEFRQGGGNVLRKAEGTGLGLSLSKRFVELHGGTLTVQSRVGEGSTFTIVLPRLEQEAVA